MLKKNIIKYKLIEEHMRAVKHGEYLYAKALLWLLRKHQVTVGLGDVDHKLETYCEGVGCRVTYSRNYCAAHIRF